MTFHRCMTAVPVLALLMASALASDIDLPVATQGTEQWAGVVAKALTFGGRDQAQSLQAMKSFQESVMAKMGKTANSLQKLGKGDISEVIANALTNADAISAPTFFATNTALFQDSIAAIQFGFTGVGVAPCAIPITPLGVGIFPQGVNIQPEGFNIAPTGVNIQPQGASISPTLIVIAPYDTTVAGQGLNIAPALISISPVRTVVNPVGPLSIADVAVPILAPALP